MRYKVLTCGVLVTFSSYETAAAYAAGKLETYSRLVHGEAPDSIVAKVAAPKAKYLGLRYYAKVVASLGNLRMTAIVCKTSRESFQVYSPETDCYTGGGDGKTSWLSDSKL